jgi:hypothetical protein
MEVAAAAGRSACGGGKVSFWRLQRRRQGWAGGEASASIHAGEGDGSGGGSRGGWEGAVWAANEEAVAGRRRRRLCSRGRSGWRRKQRWGRHRMEIRWS